ncbi:MAG: hypothetical protein HETSPECPRED_000835 [Heterodermia speciosa]|uniref:Uncharacterized protein n=1 Tax=Heterodermia speciosa TaxID=116794 RepID=A0A8H3IDN0_9LECA|nr:MAG: hypothetical protein HETSPECPRED_000835 [Heterodermia speciosa]
MPGSSDWTPVRIRGKKQSKKSAPKAAPSTSSTTQTASSTSPTSQATSSHSRKQTKRAGSASGSRAKKNNKRRRGDAGGRSVQPGHASNGAPLERLPTELLEIIFFECLNLSLPRASVSIGRRLASKHVKTKLYSDIFCQLDWEEDRPDDPGIQVFDIIDPFPGAGAFQSDLLALKWFTPTFLQNVMGHTLMKSATEFILASPNLGDTKISSTSITEGFSSLYKSSRSSCDKRWPTEDTKKHTWSLASIDQKVDGTSSKGTDSYVCPTGSIDQDFEIRFSFYQGLPHLMSIATLPTNSLSRHRNVFFSDLLFCSRGCHIPQKLLRGPWNSLKCTMLAQLLKANCVLDRSGSSTDEEVANEGLVEAIAQPSVRAIVTLVGSLRRFASECTNIPEEELEVGKRLASIDSVGLTVTNEHLMLALAKDSPLQVLECLIDARDFAVDWRDEAIREWAWLRKQQGDKRGQFLLDRYADVDVVGGAQSQRITTMPAEWINSTPSWVDDEEDIAEFSGSA